MNQWNSTQGDMINSTFNVLNNTSNWIQSNPGKVTVFAGIIQSGSTIASKGLKNWNAPSSITKSRIIAETISTKFPTSAKFLEGASKILNFAGKVVGGIGLLNTGYQWSQGNVSDARAIADGVAGVMGFFPATAWLSLGYFAAMATYEYYYNDGKPAF